FVKRTFELIAPLQPILHRVSCSNEMVPSAPKHSEMHQNLEWIGLICCKKILTQLCGLNFCIYYNSSSHFQPTIIKQRNGPKCIQTLRNKNKSLGSNGVDWLHSLRKIRTRLRGMNFCINCTSSAHFAPSFMQ